MHTSPSIRKVFEGVATRHEMHRLFNRHRGDPAMAEGVGQHLFAGEWFEINEREHDYMLEILPPLFMHADMFAMREFMTGSVTSIFFALAIDGKRRWFHGYCDLSDRPSPERMKAAIIERESRPVRAMTRDERLEHIWSSTHDDYRGYAGERWPLAMRGRRTVLVYAGQSGTVLKLLDDLTEAEIAPSCRCSSAICLRRSRLSPTSPPRPASSPALAPGLAFQQPAPRRPTHRPQRRAVRRSPRRRTAARAQLQDISHGA